MRQEGVSKQRDMRFVERGMDDGSVATCMVGGRERCIGTGVLDWCCVWGREGDRGIIRSGVVFGLCIDEWLTQSVL